jgi:pimeloyl-ACP methyl ester carboxylesterase
MVGRKFEARYCGPVVLVGHSYGGSIITEAGNDPNVAALVCIAALLSMNVRAARRSKRPCRKLPRHSSRIAARTGGSVDQSDTGTHDGEDLSWSFSSCDAVREIWRCEPVNVSNAEIPKNIVNRRHRFLTNDIAKASFKSILKCQP